MTAILSSFAIQGTQVHAGVCEKYLATAAKKYNVPVAILYAIGLTESGRKGKLHPFALNVEGKTFFAKSQRAAINIFQRERSNGKRLIDIGCMQINYKYHSHEFESLKLIFDPARNVEYAARFLRRLKNRHGSWSVAVARYHAGDKNHAAQKKYVCLVLNHLIAQKLAKQTKASKKLCNSVY